MQHLITDRQLDRFVLQEELGSGGMGLVYRAMDTATGELVAVKVVGGPEAKALDYARRFQREVEIASRLNHPNILPVLHYGSNSGTLYMVMPLVSGGTLKDFLDGGGILTPRQTLGILSQIGAALDYAHQQGVVHRDVKPHNIMLLGGDRVCLADFGLLKLSTASLTRLTVSNEMLGTPSYMSPEQIRSAEVDSRSDLYSLGVVAYECLLGRLPYHATTVYGLINLQTYAPPLLPTEINPDFPLPLQAFLLRALEKDPGQRYQTGAEMAHEFQSSLTAIPAHLHDEVLVTPAQIESSYSINWELETLDLPPLPESTISPRSQASPARRRWLPVVVGVLALLLLTSLVWVMGIQPIQARAVYAEQTAQALAQQTPIVITQMVTQIVTNEAGQPVVIVITQLVTSTPGPTPSPHSQTTQPATRTPTPIATPSLPPSPTETLQPLPLSGQGSTSGAGASATQSPPHTPAPVPTAVVVQSPPPAVPTALPPGQGGNPPGQSGDPPPGQSGDPPPGQGGSPPGQGGSPPGQSGNPPPGQGGCPPGQCNKNP